jgi:hypothetical protein
LNGFTFVTLKKPSDEVGVVGFLRGGLTVEFIIET